MLMTEQEEREWRILHCCIIYRLIDPISLHIHYVGQTRTALEMRLREHCYSPTNIAMKGWISSLRSQGLEPTIELIEEGLTYWEANDREKFWIETYHSQGQPLLNIHYIDGASIIKIGEEIYINTAETIKRLGVSRPTLDALVKRGKLKRYRQGIRKTIYYKQSEVDELLRMKETNDEEED